MALEGYNANKVNEALNNLQTKYNSLMTVMVDEVQNFINKMGNCWYAENAVTFFENFKTQMDEKIVSVSEAYSNFNSTLNKAAEEWARSTGTSHSTRKLNESSSRINISCITATNASGDRGIDEDMASSAISSLDTILTNANARLSETQTAMAESGLLGGNQQASVNNSITELKSAINTLMNNMKDHLSTEINNTKKAYGTVSSQISSAFNG